MNDGHLASATLSFRRALCTLVCVCALGALSSPVDAQQKKAAARAEELPTGMSITPLAARGSTLQPLNPGLPDLPDFTVDHPISTAVSPDGATLLILTSGYNRNNDARGKKISAQTSEYIFVFDIKQAKPVQRQALRVPNAYVGRHGLRMARAFMPAAAKMTTFMSFHGQMAVGTKQKSRYRWATKPGWESLIGRRQRLNHWSRWWRVLPRVQTASACLSPTIKMILCRSSIWKQDRPPSLIFVREKSIRHKKDWLEGNIHSELFLPATTKPMSPACATGKLLSWRSSPRSP